MIFSTDPKGRTMKEANMHKRKLSITGLQYWHAELNRLLFNNELKPAIIELKPDPEYAETFSEAAYTHTEAEPYLIIFYVNLANYEPLQALAILLHEMIHQYCRENGTEDAKTGREHNAAFMAAAEAHGLTPDGQELTAETAAMITDRLEKYFAIRILHF